VLAADHVAGIDRGIAEQVQLVGGQVHAGEVALVDDLRI
jgi:hypothetical protein